MFCPVCRMEYRLGFTRCADCGAELVPALPPEGGPAEPIAPFPSLLSERTLPDGVPLVPVLESSDQAVILAAKSVLEGAGIPCAVKNDPLQNWPGVGRLYRSHLPTGPAAIHVREEDAVAAAGLLKDFHSGATIEIWKHDDMDGPPPEG